jgi:hypothetical protein
MNRKPLILGVATVAAGILSACGGSDEPNATAGSEPPQSLDTQQVLVLARLTSDHTQPFQVNDGALTLNDTSETAEPISINAM